MSSAPQKAKEAFVLYEQYRQLSSEINQLQKRQKQVKEALESHFRSNQLTIRSSDGCLRLVRKQVTVEPFMNPGYSFWRYDIVSAVSPGVATSPSAPLVIGGKSKKK